MSQPFYDLYRFSHKGHHVKIAYRCKDGRVLQEYYTLCRDERDADTACSIIPQIVNNKAIFAINLKNITLDEKKVLRGKDPHIATFLEYAELELGKKAESDDVLYLAKQPFVEFI